MAKAQLPAEIGDRVEIIDPKHEFHENTGEVVELFETGLMTVKILECSDEQYSNVTPEQVILLVD